MTAVKKAAPKKKAIDDNQLIELYMNQVLQNNAEPKNVFVFCQENKIEERYLGEIFRKC
jgi:hypothetical protein